MSSLSAALKISTVCITGGKGTIAQALVKEFKEKKWNTFAPSSKQLDVTSSESIKKFIQPLPRLDVLICNAGILADAPLSLLKSTLWNDAMKVNLRGSWLCAQSAIRYHMLKQKSGHIIFIGSQSGKTGNSGQSCYSASKSALFALSQSIAQEHGGDSIRSNVVLPGYLKTKMNQHLSPSIEKQILEQHSLKRFNTLSEAAAHIVFLAQTQNISGQIFQLDSRLTPWN